MICSQRDRFGLVGCTDEAEHGFEPIVAPPRSICEMLLNLNLPIEEFLFLGEVFGLGDGTFEHEVQEQVEFGVERCDLLLVPLRGGALGVGGLLPLTFEFADAPLRPRRAQRNCSEVLDDLRLDDFLPHVPLGARTAALRAAEVVVAFLRLCGDETAALSTAERAAVRVRLQCAGGFGSALPAHHFLYAVEQLRCDDRFVLSLVQFSLVPNGTVVDGILEEVLDVRDGERLPGMANQAEGVDHLSDSCERGTARSVQLEGLPNKGSTNRVLMDDVVHLIVHVPDRSKGRPNTIPELLADAASNILREVVHVVLGLPERDGQHELPLRCGVEPERGEAQRADFAEVHHVDDASTINRVAREAVWVPGQNPVRLSAFHHGEHLLEHRTARLLCGAGFLELAHNHDRLARRKLTQLRALRLDREHLPICFVRGLPGVEDEPQGFLGIAFGQSHIVSRCGSARCRARIIGCSDSRRSRAAFAAPNPTIADRRITIGIGNPWKLAIDHHAAERGADGLCAHGSDRTKIRCFLNAVRTWFVEHPDDGTAT